MRDLIKKILKESDDLDWMRDIQIFDDSIPWMVKYNTEEEATDIQKKLFKMGWGWCGGYDTMIIPPHSEPYGFYFSYDMDNRGFDGYSGRAMDKAYQRKKGKGYVEYTYEHLMNI